MGCNCVRRDENESENKKENRIEKTNSGNGAEDDKIGKNEGREINVQDGGTIMKPPVVN